MVGSIAWTMWPGTMEAQQEDANGGVGIGLKQADDGRVIIDRVAPDGPAAKAGIQPGDWLVGVDRRAVAELNGSQLVDAIRGPVGSKVVLAYVRGNSAPVSATVVRAALGASSTQPSSQQPVQRPVQPANPRQRQPVVTAPVKGTMKFTHQTIKDDAQQRPSSWKGAPFLYLLFTNAFDWTSPVCRGMGRRTSALLLPISFEQKEQLYFWQRSYYHHEYLARQWSTEISH